MIAAPITMLLPPAKVSGHNCNDESSYSGILRDSDGDDGRGGDSDGSHLLKNFPHLSVYT